MERRLLRRRLALATATSFIIATAAAREATESGAAAATPVIVTGVSTRSVAVEGVTTIAVTGSGFGMAGSNALCRITSRSCGKPAWDPTGGYCTGDFTYNGAAGHEENASKPPADPNWLNPGPALVEFNATVVSNTLLRCTPPAVIVNGLGTFEVGIDGNWSGQWIAGIPIEYTLLFDIALGRRPYVEEKLGHLLVRCNTSLLGSMVAVEATLPALPATASQGWRWENVTLNGSNVLAFALGSALPATVNADMRVVITLPDGTVVTKWRRFMRAPHPPPGVMVSQVDHFRRGLLVGGEPFLGAGFYISVPKPAENESLAGSALWSLLERQASMGDNQLMPYFFRALSHPRRLQILDHCQKLGLKVMVPLEVDVPFANISADPQRHAWFKSNITAYMNHTAVLGWYICVSLSKPFSAA
jgi:hypothetical protein